MQPYADVSVNLLAADSESLSTLTVTVGQWNSLHSGPSGAQNEDRTTAMWYESDFFTGITVGTDALTAGITYTSYLSPNDSFGTVQEVSLALSLDDSDRLLVPLQPHLGLAVELSGQADGGSAEGTYFELGVEPGLDLVPDRISIWLPRHDRPEPEPLLRERRPAERRQAERRVRVLRPRGGGHAAPGRARLGGNVDGHRRRAPCWRSASISRC